MTVLIFIKINQQLEQQVFSKLEKKFEVKELVPDWKLFGGGLHESFKGGFLKVHSLFLPCPKLFESSSPVPQI